MTIWDALLQGIIQGLTEFLPVSSSGHLSLVQHFTGFSQDMGLMFTILLHCGTLAAVIIAFWRQIWDMIIEFGVSVMDIFKGRFSFKDMSPRRRMLVMIIVSLFPLIPAYFVSDYYEQLSCDSNILVEGICFLITAALLFFADRSTGGKKTEGEIKYSDSLLIGVTQAFLAPLPGVSRSGSTISVGMMRGLTREYAVAFSFIIGIPPVLASNLLNIPDAIEAGADVGFGILVVGMAVSAVVGFLAIKMVKWLIKTDKFVWFAWYTAVLGVLTIIAAIIEMASGQTILQMLA
ncbi:MAG: undecaprenyl-diphosphate phosphatase [Oscillospiraceae bacterium]|nr:undecaprenyl-diphosphate phosphatase [Oscillospiraceae bacterium]